MEHIKRMEVEFKELDEKIIKGTEFKNKEDENPKFTNDVQRFMLGQQLEYMIGYREVLRDRISFEKKLLKPTN